MRSHLRWAAIVTVPLIATPVLGQGAVPPEPSSAQVLSGIEAVNPVVLLNWDRSIRGFREEIVLSRLQTHYELRLRRLGVRTSTSAQNSLSLYITAVRYDDQLVVYSWRLALEEAAVPTRLTHQALIGALPDFEAALDTLDSPSVPRMRLSDAIRTKAAWMSTWEGTAGVGTVARPEIRGALERRAREAAEQFAEAWSLSN